MTAVQGATAQAAQPEVAAEVLFIDPCFQSWIKRHSERQAYQQLMDDPQGVIETPGSRRVGQNGTNTEYVDVVPRSTPSVKPRTMPTRFLISRERHDELLRERTAWERLHSW